MLAHSWALATATRLTIVTTGTPAESATAPFATLVTMKLHAIQDRAGEGQAKRAGDAWDIHRLLAHHNRTGEITRSIQQAPEALRDAVQAAARGVLVDGSTRARAWVHGAGGTAGHRHSRRDQLLGEQLLGLV